MSEQPLQLHPEHNALADEVARLREELAHLLTIEHELRDIVKPNLLALFQQKIGAWELRRLQAQVAALRAKRKLELAQAAINQGQAPEWAEIDGLLELELLRWHQLVQEAVAKVQAAEQQPSLQLTPGEDRELKQLYHALVKALHPDLHARLTDQQRRLWHRVLEAHERRDIGELRALLVLTEKEAPIAPAPVGLDALRRDRDALQKQVAAMEQRLIQLESQPPFTLRAQLADEAWVAARRAELDVEITQFETQLAAYAQPLAALVKLTADGQKFGSN